jgi:hypothetical protein
MEALWIISPALPFRPLGNKFSEPDALESDARCTPQLELSLA